MTRLVLLSGWAIDARVFAPLAPHWSQGWDVHAIDWPGMGTKSSSPLADPGSISQLAEAMSPELLPDQDTSVVWVGWSLGALQAAALARVMGPPDALVLIGMGPTFCHPAGVSQQALADFNSAFHRDPDRAVEHFLRWQLSAEPEPRPSLASLKALLRPQAQADHATLAQGLSTLAQEDIHDVFLKPPCPTATLCGHDDPLMAPAVRHVADERIAASGHCPMLSQPQRLVEAVERQAQRLLAHRQSIGHGYPRQTSRPERDRPNPREAAWQR
ncbi:MAG: alpha/beta fold hydrolase [Pseudomonadota bacterium]|nr:alpha/beta fold hydrolase [Pseudomonadota bacterium]